MIVISLSFSRPRIIGRIEVGQSEALRISPLHRFKDDQVLALDQKVFIAIGQFHSLKLAPIMRSRPGVSSNHFSLLLAVVFTRVNGYSAHASPAKGLEQEGP